MVLRHGEQLHESAATRRPGRRAGPEPVEVAVVNGLVLVETGMLAALDALAAAWLPSLRIGLFQGEVDVNRTLPLSQIQPATFAGYSGLHALPGWSAATLLGGIAVSYATPRLWTHDGGSIANLINGYYVTDPTGTVLIWAQELPTPILMSQSPDSVSVTPAYAVGSRYP